MTCTSRPALNRFRRASSALSGRVAVGRRVGHDRLHRFRCFSRLALVLVIAACSSDRSPQTSRTYESTPRDIAGYITEASERFNIPEEWIYAVMQVESGGRTHLNGRLITSHAGAMGLMQVMPGTYRELARRYDLGSDPHNPRDNIHAGVAYIREMYDQFGSPGFLGAYNAGPGRYAQYVEDGRRLPGETRRYMDIIAPQIAGIEPGDAPRTSDVRRPVVADVPAAPPAAPVSTSPLPYAARPSAPVISTPVASSVITTTPVVRRPVVTVPTVASPPAASPPAVVASPVVTSNGTSVWVNPDTGQLMVSDPAITSLSPARGAPLQLVPQS